MTRVMYDGITPADLPKDGDIYASYVNGNWPNFNQLAKLFPGKKYISISVFASDPAHALDVERYDASPAQAPGWVLMMRRRGLADPIVYCNSSTWPIVKSDFESQGVLEPLWWIADYNGQNQMIPGAIAHQWESTPGYDRSIAANYIPGLDAPPLTDWLAMATQAEVEAALVAALESPAGIKAIQDAVWNEYKQKDAAGDLIPMWEFPVAANNRTGTILSILDKVANWLHIPGF